MSLARQLNALTRTVLLLGIILSCLFGLKGLIFLIIGLSFLIILFYSLRNMDCRENYQPKPIHQKRTAQNLNRRGYSVEFYKPQCRKDVQKCVLNTSNPQRLPALYEQLDYGPNFFSLNQSLVGQPAQRSLIPPVTVAPPFSADWKENSFVVRSGINSQTNQDLGQSGYLVSEDTLTCSDGLGEMYCCTGDKNMELLKSTYPPKKDIVEDFSLDSSSENNGSKLCTSATSTDETYSFPYSTTHPEKEKGYDISFAEYSGEVLRSDGYYPDQVIDDNLPSNLAVGRCPKDPVFRELNKQVFTSSLQPGVYTRNQIIEPISSNIGISFTQQFEPITCEKKNNSVTFIGHDPNIMEIPHEKSEQILPYDKQTHLADIYDPRFTGYGTSYRSYVEPVTGQVRFYYDDVDAYKRPNYISRSKVDFLQSSIGTQPIPNTAYFNKQNHYARTIANDAFTNDTISFRTDLQERLMRKNNAIMEQRRRFPKYTNSCARGGMRNPRAAVGTR